MILGIENQGFNYVQCRELDLKHDANDVTAAHVYENVNGDAAKGHVIESKAPNHADHGGTKDSAKTDQHPESRPTSNVYEFMETKSSHSSHSSESEGEQTAL